MNNDKATIFGKEVDLHFSTSGHYCINIIPEFQVRKPCNEMILLENHISVHNSVTHQKKVERNYLPMQI